MKKGEMSLIQMWTQATWDRCLNGGRMAFGGRCKFRGREVRRLPCLSDSFLMFSSLFGRFPPSESRAGDEEFGPST